MNAVDLFLQCGSGDAPALVCGANVLTYGELRARVAACAGRLLEDGARKGDRVGLLAENGLFWVVAYLGILRAGLVAVPIQTEADPAAIARVVGEAGITTVLVSARQLRRVGTDLAGLRVRFRQESDLCGGEGGGERGFPEVDPERDLAALMYTSGSTGVPKGVMVTHRNIAANTGDILEYLNLTAADRVMVVLPFFYCYGLSLLHTHLAVGASLVINNQFLYPEQVLQDMLRQGCTGLAGVPSTYQILLRRSRFRQVQFPRLRWFQQAGGKLPNPFIRELLEAFPQVRFYTMYGQTEATARLSYLPPERLPDKLGSVGKGLRSTRLEVLKPDGSPVRWGSDEVGEIVASGPSISLGYWNDPQETAQFFRDGRLFTGDLARVDAEGFLYIVEREREMIKSGGNRVGAKEVEEVIAELTDVVEVAVVGVPDDILGEAIAAFVVPVRGSTLRPEDVRDHCGRRLPGFKVPEHVTFLPQLPHNANGKVVKRELRKAGGQEFGVNSQRDGGSGQGREP